MADFSKFKIGSTSYDVKDAAAGKSLAIDSTGLKLKDASDTVRSTVGIFQPYKEGQAEPAGSTMVQYLNSSTYTYNSQALTFQFEVGKYYKFSTYQIIEAFNTISIIDALSTAASLSVDCSSISNMTNDLYVYITAISGDNITAIGYLSMPNEKVYYNREIKLSDNFTIESDTLNIPLPTFTYSNVNQVLTVKRVSDGDFEYHFEYQLEDAVTLYTGECASGTYTDITWLNSVSQDTIVDEAKNFMQGLNNQKPVILSISDPNSTGIMVTLYPTSIYYDENSNETVVFSSTVYNGTNVYLYSIKMYVNGPAAQLERITLV